LLVLPNGHAPPQANVGELLTLREVDKDLGVAGSALDVVATFALPQATA
jgi:hypothetical protein